MEGRESLGGVCTVMLMIKAVSKRRGLQRHRREAIKWRSLLALLAPQRESLVEAIGAAWPLIMMKCLL